MKINKISSPKTLNWKCKCILVHLMLACEPIHKSTYSTSARRRSRHRDTSDTLSNLGQIPNNNKGCICDRQGKQNRV